MKFMEKAKRFFTLSAKHEGFTLVELIVVIAILAILAGVAVPAYSGYISRAEKAADLQLLAAVNDAFAAAVMSEGLQANEVNSAALTWSNDGKSIVGVSAVNGSANADVDTAFKLFYQGNEGTAFKVLAKNIAYDSVLHVFVDATAGFTASYKGNTIVVNGDDIQAYKNSGWGNVASSDILSLVGGVTEFAGAVDNDTFLNMLGSEAYLNAAAAALGVDPEDYDATVTAMMNDAEAKYRAENPDATVEEVNAYLDTVGGQIMANNAVLVAAQNASANKDEIIDLLTKDNGAGAKSSIAAAMGSSPADGLAQASLAYGLYTSYQMSLDPNYDTTKNPDPLDVMNALDDEGFQKYLKSDEAKTDLDGFMGALDTMSNNTGNGVGSDIVQNGFADNSELAGLLQQVLGQ